MKSSRENEELYVVTFRHFTLNSYRYEEKSRYFFASPREKIRKSFYNPHSNIIMGIPWFVNFYQSNIKKC